MPLLRPPRAGQSSTAHLYLVDWQWFASSPASILAGMISAISSATARKIRCGEHPRSASIVSLGCSLDQRGCRED